MDFLFVVALGVLALGLEALLVGAFSFGETRLVALLRATKLFRHVVVTTPRDRESSVRVRVDPTFIRIYATLFGASVMAFLGYGVATWHDRSAARAVVLACLMFFVSGALASELFRARVLAYDVSERGFADASGVAWRWSEVKRVDLHGTSLRLVLPRENVVRLRRDMVGFMFTLDVIARHVPRDAFDGHGFPKFERFVAEQKRWAAAWT